MQGYPVLSEQLQDLVSAYPRDLKAKLNGMTVEQRIYMIAQTYHGVIKLNMQRGIPDTQLADVAYSRQMVREAEEIMLEFGKTRILPIHPKLQAIFDALHMDTIREQLLDALMSYTPDWAQLITELQGTTFELGNNSWQVERCHFCNDRGNRASVLALCQVVGIQDRGAEVPTWSVGSRCGLAIDQLELGLGRRLD